MGENQDVLTAYDVRTKKKGVPIQDAVISKTKVGRYIAKGHNGSGGTLTALVGKEKAEAAIKAGKAKKGW